MQSPTIEEVVRDAALTTSLRLSVERALQHPRVRLPGRPATFEDVFLMSLRAAARRIESDARGVSIGRLLTIGPHTPGRQTDGEGLSDEECMSCIDFVHSHLVNRFKGELAELLALAPALDLIETLTQRGDLPGGTVLYWGDSVLQRRRRAAGSDAWLGYGKGADGLLLSGKPDRGAAHVVALFEVKSAATRPSRLRTQLDSHQARLEGGLLLEGAEYQTDMSMPVRVAVVPEVWRYSDGGYLVRHRGRWLDIDDEHCPPSAVRIRELCSSEWRVTLAWSADALESAAYDMTLWYMAALAAHEFHEVNIPTNWKRMTSRELGYNAAEQALYYLMLRPLNHRHLQIVRKLYNIYGFGYGTGRRAREMLWPEKPSA